MQFTNPFRKTAKPVARSANKKAKPARFAMAFGRPMHARFYGVSRTADRGVQSTKSVTKKPSKTARAQAAKAKRCNH